MMTNTPWVYIKSESDLWTVGFYDPSSTWHSDSDHDSIEEAAKRVNYLNGREQTSKVIGVAEFYVKEKIAAIEERLDSLMEISLKVTAAADMSQHAIKHINNHINWINQRIMSLETGESELKRLRERLDNLHNRLDEMEAQR